MKINFKLLVVIMACLSVIMTMRALFTQAFFRTHDFTHAARLVEMQTSLLAGEFPVRWSRNFGFGYGMPLFNFYAPLPYYVGQVPLAFHVTPIDTTKLLYILNAILAFFGMFLLARTLWGKEGGLIAAVTFSFSSYRAVDLFVRGALGEAFAFVLLPFVLYGLLLIREQRRWGWIVSSFFLACILLSHNLTGMIALVVCICFWLGLGKARRTGWALLLSLIMGVGLSAFYTLPAFFEKNYTRVDQTIVGGNFDYHNHFLCATQLLYGKWGYGGSFPGCNDDISFALGMGSIFLFLLGITTVSLLGRKMYGWKMIVVVAAFFFSALMTIGRSVWIWDHILLLKYFQFPWRFLTFTHVFMALGTGACGILWRKKKWGKFIVSGLLVVMIACEIPHFWPEKLLVSEDLKPYYTTTPTWIRSDTSKTLNDYLPPVVMDNALPAPVATRFTSTTAIIQVIRDDPAHAAAIVNCSVDCQITVQIFQFPGWRATLDGKNIGLVATRGGVPIYTISIPAGQHMIEVVLGQTPIRVLGNLISLVSLVFMLTMVYFYARKRVHKTV